MELKIRESLKRKSKTAVWLATEIGIAQPSMSNIVNNKVSPSLETLEKIATALNVEIVDLFDNPKSANLKCPHCGGDLNVKIE
jgi:transcriptional regulator with XRE-family HTH domain